MNVSEGKKELPTVDPDETTQVENENPEVAEAEDKLPDDMWASLSDDSDEEDELSGVEEDAGSEEESEEPATEEVATEVEKPAEVQPPAQPTEAKAPETEIPPQQPQQPQQPQLSQEELQKQITAQREQLLEQLAQQFPITQDDADLLVTAPEKVMPKMAANLFLRTYEAVMQGVRQQMPQMMAMTAQVQEQKTALENEFYSKWEGLDRKKHGELVNRYGMVYLQANPNATKEDFIRDVGASAMVALGLPFQQMQPPPSSMQPPPVKPSAPVGRPPAPNRPMNQFEQLAADFEEEDI